MKQSVAIACSFETTLDSVASVKRVGMIGMSCLRHSMCIQVMCKYKLWSLACHVSVQSVHLKTLMNVLHTVNNVLQNWPCVNNIMCL